MPDKAIDRVVAAWRKGQAGAANSDATLGQAVHLLIVKMVRGVGDRQARRKRRGAAIASASDAILQAGGQASHAHLNRCVKMHQLAILLDVKHAPVLTVRALLPLVKRNPRDESWTLRHEDQARTLASQLEGMTPAVVRLEVDKILNRKPRAPKPKPTAAERVMKLLPELSVEDQQTIFRVLAKRFAPKPEAPPAKRSMFGRDAA